MLTRAPTLASIVSPSFAAPLPSPVIFADFVNGVYQINGVGTTIDQLFFDNSGAGAPPWDPANVTPGTGLTNLGSTSNPSFQPAAFGALLTSGMTVMLAFNYGASAFSSADIEWFKAGFAEDFSFGGSANGKLAVNDGHGHIVRTVANVSINALHKAAATLSQTDIAVSLDGAATVFAVPTNPGSMGNGYLTLSGDTTVFVTQLAAYAPLGHATLPILSAP